MTDALYRKFDSSSSVVGVPELEPEELSRAWDIVAEIMQGNPMAFNELNPDQRLFLHVYSTKRAFGKSATTQFSDDLMWDLYEMFQILYARSKGRHTLNQLFEFAQKHYGRGLDGKYLLSNAQLRKAHAFYKRQIANVKDDVKMPGDDQAEFDYSEVALPSIHLTNKQKL